ncbi:MAG: alpha/beta hydrolase [Myxococcaceae bacterium]
MNDTKRVVLPQGTIHYRDVGEGPPVVFVHGLLVNGSVFGDVPDRLKGYRCLVPHWPLGSHPEAMNADADLSSHGLAALIAAFLEKLDLRDVTLVGNDSGGALCQFVCARHPERVGRLVLTTCDAFECFPPPAFQYLLTCAKVPGVMSVMSASMRLIPALQRMNTAYGNLTVTPIAQPLLDDWVGATADSGVRRDVGKFMRSIDSKQLLAAYETLKTFDKPVLLVWTPRDRNFPVTLAHRLLEVFPKAKLELVDDAKVFVSLDQPAKVAELIASQSWRSSAAPTAAP